METATTSGTKRRRSASFHPVTNKRRCTAPLRLETSDSEDLRKPNTERHALTTTCWVGVEEDTLTTSDGGQRARLEDVTNSEDNSIFGGGEMSRLPIESSGVKLNQGSRDAHTHSSALSPVFGPTPDAVQKAGHCLPDGTFELQATSTAKIARPWKIGNTYSHVQVLEEARVHLGDSYTVNNHYSGSIAAAEGHIVARIEITQEFLMTLSAAVGLVRALLQTTTGLFLLLQVTMSAYRLPKQISDKLAVFEDALGRFQRIDLRFLDSWPRFRMRLESDFHGTPGSRRILRMEYRLFDPVRDHRLIDPRYPPPFTSVFKQGTHVKMSIHFEWHEVPDEQCPRCGLTQERIVNAETICVRCKFTYRGQVESSRAEEVDDEGTPLQGNHYDVRDTARLRIYPQDRDQPAYFSRITISAKPMSTCRNCSASYSRAHDKCHVCDHFQARSDDRDQTLGERSPVPTRNQREAPPQARPETQAHLAEQLATYLQKARKDPVKRDELQAQAQTHTTARYNKSPSRGI